MGRAPKRWPGNVDGCLTAMRGQSNKMDFTTAFLVVENRGSEVVMKVAGL